MSDNGTFKLIIEDDEGSRSVVPIELGEASIGRLESNAIRLDQRNVSREHARFVRENDTVFAEDLDSYNGVWINGARISGRHEIREGDLIRIGDFQLELRGEGLLRRTEETTQRTVLPADELTHPDIRLTGEFPAADLPSTIVPAPAPTPALSAPPISREPARRVAQIDDVGQHEATAIIRLDAPELQAPRHSSTITGHKAKLVCVSTQFAGREFEIAKTEVVIGRTPDNDVAIDHRSVSRHHAKIVVANRRYILHDLKSANGTLVNGEAYAQTELKRGDLVELGHVKLRFVPPGEGYTLSADELAAVRAGAAEEEETVVGPPRRIPLLYAGLGGAVLLLIAAVVVFSVSRSQPDRQPVMVPAVTAGVGGSHVEALLGRAQVALAQRRWEQAANLGAEVLTLDPTSMVARDLVLRAQTERDAQARYDLAQRAVERGDWSTAWQALQALPSASVYAEQSRELVLRVQGALVADLISRGRAALEAGDLDGALQRANEIAAIDAMRPEIAQIRGEIERARAGARSASAPAAGAVKVKSKSASATRPLEKKASVSSPSPSPSLGTPPGDPAAAYNEGKALLSAGDLDGAIEAFTRCVQAEPGFALCYRALGIAHARSGNGSKAARFYKQYLKADPNAKDAEQVRQLLEQYETAP